MEKILDSKRYRNTIKYLVKWKGYQEYDATWEPKANLTHAKMAIREYDQHNKGRRQLNVINRMTKGTLQGVRMSKEPQGERAEFGEPQGMDAETSSIKRGEKSTWNDINFIDKLPSEQTLKENKPTNKMQSQQQQPRQLYASICKDPRCQRTPETRAYCNTAMSQKLAQQRRLQVQQWKQQQEQRQQEPLQWGR